MKTNWKPSLALLAPTLALNLLHTASVGAAPLKAAVKTGARPRKMIREVLGTQPLQGWEGSLSVTFTLGTNPAFNWTLRKVQYEVRDAALLLNGKLRPSRFPFQQV